MTLPRRKFLHLAAGAAVLPAISRIARADTYPSHPVRILVGFAAGSTTDILGRLIGQWLSQRLGQQFIIENRPGAGGNIAAEEMIKSDARRLHALHGAAGSRGQWRALPASEFRFSPRRNGGRRRGTRAQCRRGQSVAAR